MGQSEVARQWAFARHGPIKSCIAKTSHNSTATGMPYDLTSACSVDIGSITINRHASDNDFFFCSPVYFPYALEASAGHTLPGQNCRRPPEEHQYTAQFFLPLYSFPNLRKLPPNPKTPYQDSPYTQTNAELSSLIGSRNSSIHRH